MRKSPFIFLYFLLYSSFSYTQIPIDLKKGGYMSLNSFINNSPNVNYNLEIKKRSKYDIAWFGGNDYKISSQIADINRIIDKDLWFINDGDSLYINGIFVNGCSFYCKIENNGKYLYFKSGIPRHYLYKKLGFKRKMIAPNYYFGGGALGGAVVGSDHALARYYYFLDTNSGEIKVLTWGNLLQILPKDSAINKEFLNDKLNGFQFEQLKYLDRLNK